MNSDPDPFEQGERAARENIPAEANPYQDGSEQHALWAAPAMKKLPVHARRTKAKVANLVRTSAVVSRSSSARF